MAHSRFATDSQVDHGSIAANILHSKLEEVIKSWDERIQIFVLAAKTKTYNERVDSLVYFLHGLIEALSPGGEEIETGDAAHVFRRHGEQRAMFNDYTLNQVISEYALLRDTVLDFLKDEPIEFKEQMIINQAVDFGMKESCSEFTNVRNAQIRRSLMQAEAELEHERHLLNGFQDPFIALDFDYRISFINDAGTLILRQPKEELINKNIWDLIPAEQSNEFRQSISNALEKREASVVDLLLRTGEITYEARIYPCKDGVSVLLLNQPHKSSTEDIRLVKAIAPQTLQ